MKPLTTSATLPPQIICIPVASSALFGITADFE